MEAYARSSGTLSCSGSHLSQDIGAISMHPGCRTGRSWPHKSICRALRESCRPVSASVHHEEIHCRADRDVLCAVKANARRSAEPDKESLHTFQHANHRSWARAAGFAAVSVTALLHPSDAHAAELVPLDLFSSFLVSSVFLVWSKGGISGLSDEAYRGD